MTCGDCLLGLTARVGIPPDAAEAGAAPVTALLAAADNSSPELNSNSAPDCRVTLAGVDVLMTLPSFMVSLYDESGVSAGVDILGFFLPPAAVVPPSTLEAADDALALFGRVTDDDDALDSGVIGGPL